jgi:hypothetical protein
MADTAHSKRAALEACGFESRPEHFRGTLPPVEFICAKCRHAFQRPEWRPKALRHKPVYCCNPCRPTPFNAGGNALSPFRKLFHHTDPKRGDRGSARGLVRDIDPQYLKDLWESQRGLCPLTGWKLSLPISARRGWEQGHHPHNASLDRIDQSKGYVRGNVRFVVLIAQYARHSWSDDVVREFASAVVEQGSFTTGLERRAQAVEKKVSP